jgi:hypothetical protein
MLKVCRKEEARLFYQLVQVLASPYTKDGQGVKDMLEYYKEIINE